MAASETLSVKVACDATACGYPYEYPGKLAAHKVAAHGSLPSIALVRARHQFGFATEPPPRVVDLPISRVDPLGLDRNGIKKNLAPPPPTLPRSERRAAAPLAKRPCVHCARVAPDRCHRHGGVYQRARIKKTSATCWHCARVAPEQCARHGGVSHSSSFKRETEATCRICVRTKAKYGTACALHGGPRRGSYQKLKPDDCRLCAKMIAKDGQPCQRHGGPSRGTAWHQRVAARSGSSSRAYSM